MSRHARTILWVDACAAASAGLAVSVLREWLAHLYGFPISLVLFLGFANLAYASYSGSLAVLASTGRLLSVRAVDLLVLANSCWVLVCAAVLASTMHTASVFGIAHLVLEGAFVGSLALVERRWVRPFAR